MTLGFKQTEVGTIPDDWQVVPFLSAVQIANGQVDPRIEPYRSMILIAPDHIESGSGKLIQKRTASAQAAISGKYLFDSGDIVYSKIRPYLRKATIAKFRGLCSADMYPLKARKGIESGFILPVLLSHRFSIFAEGVSARTGIPKINREDLSAFSIALPPQNEQRAIATALSDVDALLTSLDALIAKKRDIKQAAMQQLLTGKTRLPGFSGEWEVRRLGELGATYGGLVGKSKKDFGHGVAQYVPFVNVMANVVIDPDAFDAVDVGVGEVQNKVLIGDLLFNGSSETPEELAMCSLVDRKIENLFLNSFCFGFRMKIDAPANGLFMAYFMRGPVGREFVKSLAQGSTRYNLSKLALLNGQLRLPGKDEQAAIAKVLSDMDAELAALEARRDKTRLLKQGMMQELLTGKTRLV
ncbi:restriction endonuclease subunit S [Burkholderia multivorans]|uniref:restriction endonuclease subunit S n=1 Tax=Burkholderia multivorans TaxID=87883 RepID=UPI0020B2A190|nr:restriction endonuclease subunit S [Burkholderia multivorans]